MKNGCRAYLEQIGKKQGEAILNIYGEDESFKLNFMTKVKNLQLINLLSVILNSED